MATALSQLSFSFDPATHSYAVAGFGVVPSVTQVLQSVKIGPDFEPTHHRCPNCGTHLVKTTVDAETLKRKCDLGLLVHEACVVLDEGDDLDWDRLGPAEPYVRGYRKFIIDTRFRATMLEYQTVACLNGMYYGMKLDREGLLNGQPHVVEIKTPEKAEPSWGVQLAAYALGLPRPVLPPFRYQRLVVNLRPNGTYRLISYDDPGDEEVFKYALAMNYWKRHHRLN
jgi:hypothetical protein